MNTLAASSSSASPAPARSDARELVLALLAGACTWLGIKLAQRLEDPYSEPRLTIDASARDLRDTLLTHRRGGGDTP